MNKIFPDIDFSPEQLPLRRSVWLIFISAAVILFFLLGENALHGSEGNMAESIRLLSSDKDIFAQENWSQAAEKMPLWFARLRMFAADFFGCSEFSCRLFSVIAAIFCLGGTMKLAHEFFDRRTMCCAAWLLIGSYGFVYWGRHISTFMTLTAWAVWCACMLYRPRMNFWIRSVICFMLLAGSLWWGLNFILLIPGIFYITFERSKKFFLHWDLSAALLSGAALLCLVMAWQVSFPGIAWSEYPFRVWRQISGTFMESFYELMPSVSEKWYKVWINLLRLLLPWTLPALVVIVGMFRTWSELSAKYKHFLTGSMMMVVLLAVFPGYRWQYQLSLLPFFLILTAGGISECTGVEAWNQKVNILMKWFFAVLCSFCLCAIMIWPLWKMIFLSSPPLWIMFGLPVLGAAGLAALIFDTGRSSSVENVSGMNGTWSGYILAGACFMMAMQSVTIPSLTRYRAGKSFWQKCGKTASELPPDEVIFYGSEPDPKARFYMALPHACTVVRAGDLPAHLAQAKVPELLLVIRKKDIPELRVQLLTTQWSLNSADPEATENSPVDFSEVTDDHNSDKYQLLQLTRKNGKY